MQRNRALSVIDATVRVTGIDRKSLLDHRRCPHIMDARRAAAMAAVELGISQSRIARALNRDHSTVKSMLHGRPRNRESARRKCERVEGVAAQIVAVVENPVNGGVRGKIVFRERVV